MSNPNLKHQQATTQIQANSQATAEFEMWLHRWSKHNCTAPWEDDEGDYYRKWMYSIDGGSGAILSRGLMKAINHVEIEDCIRNQ